MIALGRARNLHCWEVRSRGDRRQSAGRTRGRGMHGPSVAETRPPERDTAAGDGIGFLLAAGVRRFFENPAETRAKVAWGLGVDVEVLRDPTPQIANFGHPCARQNVGLGDAWCQ